LSTYSTSAENIRKEYEFLKRLNENETELHRISPETNFIVRSSISGLFRKNSLARFSTLQKLAIQINVFYRFKLLGMISGLNVDCPLTTVDRIGCNGRISSSENRLLNSSVQFSWKRAISTSSHFEVFYVQNSVTRFSLKINHLNY
jgi:hypothetical protein